MSQPQVHARCSKSKKIIGFRGGAAALALENSHYQKEEHHTFLFY
jgi:hypothetical protein